jgi:hypothetical protein
MSPTALTVMVGGPAADGGASDDSSAVAGGDAFSVAGVDGAPVVATVEGVCVAATVSDVSAAGLAMPGVPVNRMMSVDKTAATAGIATSRRELCMGPPLGILLLRYHTAYSEETGKLA